MRIFVVGANGRLGRLVVARALDKGHEVTAFVRDGRTLPAHPALSVVLGPVADDLERVRAAVAGHDAVLSDLGNPLWLKGGRGPAIVSAAVTNVVAAMREGSVGRVVVPLAWGTGASRPHASVLVRAAAATLIRRDFSDFGAAEDVLARSTIDWTIAYFGSLTDAPAGSAWEASVDLHAPANLAISRADLAQFLVASATEGTFIRQRVVLNGPVTERMRK